MRLHTPVGGGAAVPPGAALMYKGPPHPQPLTASTPFHAPQVCLTLSCSTSSQQCEASGLGQSTW